MRVLLSTIGSRGDVQPLVALALQLRELGQEVRICAPPDFREWIGTLGIPFVPVGPEVRQTAAPNPSAAQAPPAPEHLYQAAARSSVFSPIQPRPGGARMKEQRLERDESLHTSNRCLTVDHSRSYRR